MSSNREPDDDSSPSAVARSCIDAGIEAAHPATVVGDSVALTGDELTVDGTVYDLSSYEDVVVLGGGNAAGTVAAALESILGERLTDGVVVTDVPEPTTTIDVVDGSHPVPDERGLAGAERILDRAGEATADTLVLGVVTGGGSALLPAPAGDVTLDDLQTVTDDLLGSGATIHEINAVRKHLSAIKGGRLAAAAAPATVVGLVFSDVVGDDLDVVASGPLVPDASTFADALDVVDRYDVALPPRVEHHLERGVDGDVAETPAPGADAFATVDVHVLANGLTALTAAGDAAADRGYTPLVLSSRVRGEAREAAKTHVGIAEEVRATGHPIAPPAVVLSGGETTVTLSDDAGAGGPNQEFALSAAIELDADGVVVGSVDTDGIDGASDAAGAIVDGETTERTSMDARAALAANEASPFLEAAGALVETGPTGTNVNDLRVLVVADAEEGGESGSRSDCSQGPLQ
ncbi:glycerate kinase [halophilic archaeon]|nr:glycerate kinase [halophilic archaeon]